MNYIKHLAGFFEKAAADQRLNPTHISLYISLFQYWNIAHFVNPISISRAELMKLSKIGSGTTYGKCINELHKYGYISYQPSFNAMKGSLVYLFNFATGTGQEINNSHTKNQTAAGQALVTSINDTNNKKNKKQKYSQNNTKVLHDNNSKNYSEPL